eukprot:TRINITY_DN39774_c0_g1_i1.p1 TRINITY_DN39774_c0_g1~~TRINITY_DN39774_c0_g1_i1.p1  ORF type:complete len:948 (+),score=273.43 TRINITY_DN39774_c0_g1_i1:90-2933(+)
MAARIVHDDDDEDTTEEAPGTHSLSGGALSPTKPPAPSAPPPTAPTFQLSVTTPDMQVTAAPAAPPPVRGSGYFGTKNQLVPSVTGGGPQDGAKRVSFNTSPAAAPPAAATAPDYDMDDDGPYEGYDDGYSPILFAPWERVRAKKRLIARMFFAEALAYGVFLTLFCLVAIEFRSEWSFWMAETVRDAVLRSETHKFDDIRTTADVYEWAQEILFPGLMAQEWEATGRPKTAYDQRFAAGYNRLIGAVRWRQVRVKKNTGCKVSDKFAAFIRDCYPSYSDSVEMQASYGPAWNRTQFRYETASELCDKQFGSSRYCKAFPIGRRGDVYPAGGYVQDFPIDLKKSLETLDRLRRGDWIDAHTRAVMIDFNVYNTNVRLLCVTQLMVEWFPTGRVTTKASLKPISLLTLELPTDIALFVGEILLTVYLLGYLSSEIHQWIGYAQIKADQCLVCRKRRILRTGDEKQYYCIECDYLMNPFRDVRCPQCQREYNPKQHLCWRGYFQDVWNWLDMINFIFFAAVFGIRYDLRYQAHRMNFDVGDTFIMLYPLAWQFVTANYLNSVNALLCFTKAFKYLGRISRLRVLVDTMRKARKEIGYFMVLFVLIFFAFGLAFHLGFGLEAEGYRDFGNAVVSLFRMMLGEFRYDDLEQANRLLAPILLIFFNLIVLFVLCNMFVAIVGAAYAAAWDDSLRGRDDFDTSALRLFLYAIKYKFFGCIGWKTPYGYMKVLLDNLDSSLHLVLSSRQMDDLRTFRNEVEHNPDNDALFNDVLRAFERDVDREMDIEDFETLRDAVREHKAKLQSGVEEEEDGWDDDDMSDVDGDLGGDPDGPVRRESEAVDWAPAARATGPPLPSVPAPRGSIGGLGAEGLHQANSRNVVSEDMSATNERLRGLEQGMEVMTDSVRKLLDTIANQSAAGDMLRGPGAPSAPPKSSAPLPPAAQGWLGASSGW